MDICDFSSLIQLSAALSVALVAVEYSKTYPHILSDRVFNFKELVRSSFKTIIEKISGDSETLEHINPVEIDGVSTVHQIEDIKRKYEKLNERITKDKELLIKDADQKCESKSFSALSLWTFLYCFTALFLCGFKDTIAGGYVKIVWMFLTFLTLIYFVCGWYQGEKNKQVGVCDFTSLRHVILWFLSFVILSCLLSWRFFYCCVNSIDVEIQELFWNIFLIGSVLLCYLNFIVFFIKIRQKVSLMKTSIQNVTDDRQRDYDNLKAEVDELVKVNKVKSKLIVE